MIKKIVQEQNLHWNCILPYFLEFRHDASYLDVIYEEYLKLLNPLKSMKKIYVKDNGFLQVLPKLSSNLGNALENAVFNALSMQQETVPYLKDNYEIDFYAAKILYQVSYDIREEKTKKRELNAFGYFKKSDEVCKLITFETDEVIENVEVISFERFALP
ncbi:MAG: hypothetical protein WC667_01715 [Sulfurimonas sp.]